MMMRRKLLKGCKEHCDMMRCKATNPLRRDASSRGVEGGGVYSTNSSRRLYKAKAINRYRLNP